MKRTLALILALILCLSFAACGSKDEKEPLNEPDIASEAEIEEEVIEESIPSFRLGEAIETDILRITLTRADLAIKLNSTSSGTYDEIKSGKTTLSDDYFTAEEYDPKTDVGVAYVAPKGHTYVAIEYKADNLDRASVDFDGPFYDGQFMSVEYNGDIYNEDTNYGCRSINGYQWERYSSPNVLLLAGEEVYYRCYIDIPTDADDLKDEFSLVFSLPNSDGDVTKFRYDVRDEDRVAMKEQELSVDEAVYAFTQEEGQEYFRNHMEEYQILSGEEVVSVVEGRKWDIVIKESYGSWTGAFKFDADGKIQETIPSVGTGYYNDRTWKIDGDTLILDNEDVCQVRQVEEDTYLLVKDDAPYAIMN